MIKLESNQILVYLSAAHLDECRQWQHQLEEEWQQAQQQASQSTDTQPSLMLPRGGAIGGAFTYTIRPQIAGYHLRVQDAISQIAREWTASHDCADWTAFFCLHEREYDLLWQWFAQREKESFEQWVQTQLEYQFCHNTLGSIIRVRDLQMDAQLDLTDYEGW